MSLWHPDRLCIGLDTTGVRFAHFSDRSARRWHRSDVVQSASMPSWQGSTECVAQELLEMRLTQSTRIEVLLSAALMRYLVVPWNAAFSTPSSREAFAAHCFRETFGDLDARWSSRLAPTRFAEPTLAVAVDMLLLERLRELFTRTHLRLTSIRPSTSDAFAACAGQINDKNYWLVVLSDARYVIFRQEQGVLSHVQVLASAEGSPTMLIERIKRSHGMELGVDPIHFAEPVAIGSRVSSFNWKLTRLGPSDVRSAALAHPTSVLTA